MFNVQGVPSILASSGTPPVSSAATSGIISLFTSGLTTASTLCQFTTNVSLHSGSFPTSTLTISTISSFQLTTTGTDFRCPILRKQRAVVTTLSSSLDRTSAARSIDGPQIDISISRTQLSTLIRTRRLPRSSRSQRCLVGGHCRIRLTHRNSV